MLLVQKIWSNDSFQVSSTASNPTEETSLPTNTFPDPSLYLVDLFLGNFRAMFVNWLSGPGPRLQRKCNGQWQVAVILGEL